VSRIRAQVHLISFAGDHLFFPEEMEHLAKMLRRHGQSHSYHEIASDYGHDAFLVEIDKFDHIIRHVLEKECR
jgi:homoserine O-acetyltransferase